MPMMLSIFLGSSDVLAGSRSAFGISPLPPLVSLIFANTLPTADASLSSSPIPPMCMNMTFGESQKKMIVKRSDVQAVVQCHTHHRIDLVFEQSGITHNHRLAACIHKRGIGGQAHSRVHLHSTGGHLKIRARRSNSKHAFFFVELSFYTCKLLDFRGV